MFFKLFILLILCITLLNSLLMIYSKDFGLLHEKNTLIKFSSVIMFLALMIILPWQIGDIARSESSAIPFIVFQEVLLKEGYLIAFCATITNIINLLWIFYIPGHLVSCSKYKETGVKITYPYIINILIGLLLVTPSNPVYKFMLLFV